MNDMSSLTTLSVIELRERLVKGELKAVDLLDACLARSEEQADLNCYISLQGDTARTRALSITKEQLKQPLGGIPVAVKDLILVKDTPTTAGSRMLQNFTAPYNAAVVEKINASGAVIPGKTNLDEFAMGSSNETSAFGPVKNPWDKSRVAGGSSGGSAAAVAAGLVPAALGTDTGGSVRQPASYCGITGIKPTYGRVSRYGVIAFASSLDQVGVFGKSVRDAALLLSAISGYDKRDSTSMKSDISGFVPGRNVSIKGLRIGVPEEYMIGGIQPEVDAAVSNALKQLESQGAKIVSISLPHTEYAVATYYIIAPAEASSNLGRYDGVRYGYRAAGAASLSELYQRSRTEGFGQEVKRRILIGTYVLSHGYYDAYYLQAQKVRRLIQNDFLSAFKDQCDVIACPTTPTTAFKIGEKIDDPISMYLNDIFTVPASLAGLPGLSIPCGMDNSGLPVGLQLIGQHWDEARLCAVAAAYQDASDWHLKLPLAN